MSSVTDYDTELASPAIFSGFTRDIECSRSINGVFTLQIVDFEKIRESGMYAESDCFDECLSLHYRRVPTKESCDLAIDGKWRIKQVFIGNVGPQMAIRVPVYMTDYNIECFIRMKILPTGTWTEPSKTVTINIPSFLLTTEWKVGDRVVFQPKSEYYTLDGELSEILPDDLFRIRIPPSYVDQDLIDNNDSLCIALNPDNTLSYAQIEVSKSRMYREDQELQWTVDLAPTQDIRKLVLLGTEDPESLAIFDAIYDDCIIESKSIAMELFEDGEPVIHYQPMAQFLAKNVYDFLFCKRFYFKLDCLLDPIDHGPLTLWNVHQFHVKATYEIRRQRLGNAQMSDPGCFAGYSCDICRIGLHYYDYLFECDNGYMASHDFCINCTTNVIRMNSQLKELLSGLLKESLIDECIDTIADFVVGKTTLIVRASEDNGAKRRMSDYSEPASKRPKLCH